MKYVKMLGLLAVAAAALMAFVGTASATLYEGPGDPVDKGETVHAHSSNTILTGTVEVSCKESTVHGTITNAGGTSGPINELTFKRCGPEEKDTVSVLKAGSLSIDASGAVSSVGAEVTIQLHRTVLGFPVTTHCIYQTKSGAGTVIGSLTGGSGAKLDINGEIPRLATDGGCGSEPAIWEGNYTITTPAYLGLS